MLLLILSIGLVVPFYYLMETPRFTQLRERQYSEANITQPSPELIQSLLSSLGQTMSPNDLSHIHSILGSVAHYSINKEDHVVDYLRTMSSLTGNLTEINATIPTARASIESGNFGQAQSQIRRLESLRETSRFLLSSVNSSLIYITDHYQIDATQQLQKIKGFEGLLQTYSAQIDRLADKLSALQNFVPTVLTLNASRRQVSIAENLTVFGFLKEPNGTLLADRNITISWGSNNAILTQTDFRGRFEANVSFPVGYPAGPSRIEADYVPSGRDSGVLVSSSTTISVDVMYLPSLITARISQATVRPLDQMSVMGSLGDAGGIPLKIRTIVIDLDGVSLGNTTTDSLGQFIFRFTITEAINNGTHTLNVVFPAAGERYAPSNETIPFTVEILGTVVQMELNRSWIFSGMNVSVAGNLTYASGSIPSGKNVSISFDNQSYVNATVEDNGSFHAIIHAPFWLSLGSHRIKAEYLSQDPGVQGTETVATILVYSVPLIIFAATIISTATALSAYLISRRKKGRTLASIVTPEPVEAGRLMRQEFSRDFNRVNQCRKGIGGESRKSI